VFHVRQPALCLFRPNLSATPKFRDVVPTTDLKTRGFARPGANIATKKKLVFYMKWQERFQDRSRAVNGMAHGLGIVRACRNGSVAGAKRWFVPKATQRRKSPLKVVSNPIVALNNIESAVSICRKKKAHWGVSPETAPNNSSWKQSVFWRRWSGRSKGKAHGRPGASVVTRSTLPLASEGPFPLRAPTGKHRGRDQYLVPSL